MRHWMQRAALLVSKELLFALELDDAGRRTYLTRIETGYTPPRT